MHLTFCLYKVESMTILEVAHTGMLDGATCPGALTASKPSRSCRRAANFSIGEVCHYTERNHVFDGGYLHFLSREVLGIRRNQLRGPSPWVLRSSSELVFMQSHLDLNLNVLFLRKTAEIKAKGRKMYFSVLGRGDVCVRLLHQIVRPHGTAHMAPGLERQYGSWISCL